MSDIINFETILADIRTGISTSDDAQRVRVRKLKTAAAYEFARINNWQITPKIFSPQSIGKRGDTNHSMPEDIFDHCISFRGNGRNAAIVAEPYPPDRRQEAAAFASEHGIALHVPPNPQASIWFPGHAFFLVFTARGHTIQWLPEQMVQS
jgi:hypothetical protein